VVNVCDIIQTIKNYGEIIITNLVPYKTANPKLLNDIEHFAIRYNDYYLENEIEYSDTIIFAYGDINHKKFDKKTEDIFREKK